MVLSARLGSPAVPSASAFVRDEIITVFNGLPNSVELYVNTYLRIIKKQLKSLLHSFTTVVIHAVIPGKARARMYCLLHIPLSVVHRMRGDPQRTSTFVF